MVRTCCVENCRVEWYPNINVTFHSFPWKNPVQLEKWISVIPTKCRITKHTNICSAHFDISDLVLTGVRRALKKNAIPRHFDVNEPVETLSQCFMGITNCADNENVTELSVESLNGLEKNLLAKENVCETSQRCPDKEPISEVSVGSFLQNDESINLSDTSLPQEWPKQFLMNNSVLARNLQYTSNTFVSERDRLQQKLTEKTQLFFKKEKMYRKKVKMLQDKLRRQTRNVMKLRLLIKDLRKIEMNSRKLHTKLVDKFPEDVLELFNNEVNNRGKIKTAFRYTEKIKAFATSIYAESPKVYRFLRSKFVLPDESVLQKAAKRSATLDSRYTAHIDNL